MNTEPKKKKVLIITYYWPPSGGSPVLRWLKFVKYLHEFGWTSTIYTPGNPEPQAIDESLLTEIPEQTSVIKRKIFEPYSIFKLFTGKKNEKGLATSFISEKKAGFFSYVAIWIRGNFFIPDARKFWIKPSIAFLSDYLRDNPHDLIISTGPPHSMHLIAWGVKKKSGIPWLADFRDPWTNIDFYKDLNLTYWADRRHHTLEKRVITEADSIVTVSPTLTKEFIEAGARSAFTITNGFDEVRETVPPKTDSLFSILHVGSLPASRNPVTLWKSLQIMMESKPDFKNSLSIELIGNVDYSILQSLEKYGLSDFVIRKPHLPHSEALERMLSARLLLLVVNNTQNAKGILTNKFFEYLAARRPIIAIGPTDGDVAEILKESMAGRILDFNDEEGTISYLDELHTKYTCGAMEVEISNIDRFTRRNLTASLVTIINQIIK
jgi:hypothetical protein